MLSYNLDTIIHFTFDVSLCIFHWVLIYNCFNFCKNRVVTVKREVVGNSIPVVLLSVVEVVYGVVGDVLISEKKTQ